MCLNWISDCVSLSQGIRKLSACASVRVDAAVSGEQTWRFAKGNVSGLNPQGFQVLQAKWQNMLFVISSQNDTYKRFLIRRPSGQNVIPLPVPSKTVTNDGCKNDSYDHFLTFFSVCLNHSGIKQRLNNILLLTVRKLPYYKADMFNFSHNLPTTEMI